MRRTLSVALGVLELIVAGCLFYAITLLPSEGDVRDPLGNIERVAKTATDGVGQLRERLATLRQRQPQLRQVAQQMRDNTRTVVEAINAQAVDFVSVEMIRDALGDVANGLDALRDHLRADSGKQAKESLRATADFLDTRIARDLNLLVPGIKADAEALAKVLRRAEDSLSPSLQNVPRLQANLKKASEMLRQTQAQLALALENKDEYEAALRMSTSLARAFTATLPLFTEQLETDLSQQEDALGELHGGLAQLRGALPGLTSGTARFLVLGRWLLLLVGGIFVLHGGVSILSRGS